MNEHFLKECILANLNIQHQINLAPLNCFKTGNKAEMFVAPHTPQELQTVLHLSTKHNIPQHIIGGGSNILVPDVPVQGLTISTLALQNIHIKHNQVIMGSGVSVRTITSMLANKGYRGLDFLYGMPGSIGGALWMNARCYGKEISEVLVAASGYAMDGTPWTYKFQEKDFSYKQSPFIHMGVISECTINTYLDNPIEIWKDMLDHEMDRTHKGHYIAPCAGSVFKNNREFGEPTGSILDTLQWKGKTYNNAMVNPYHANIIINKGNAKSQDIYTLALQMATSAQETRKIELEQEVILFGGEATWTQ